MATLLTLTSRLPRRSAVYLVILVIIVLVAFALRVTGIDWGLPSQNLPHSQFVQDETAELFTTLILSERDYQLSLIRNQPAFYYISFIYFLLYYVFGVATGRYGNLADFQAHYGRDLTQFFIIGRYFIMLIGALTVALVYTVGTRLFDKRTGIVSAVLLAFSFGHVLFSKIFRLDSILPFLFLLSFYLIVRLRDAKPGKLQPYVLCGILIGVTATTKVTGLALLIPYLLSPVIEDPPWSGGKLHFPKIDRRYPFGLVVIVATYIALAGPAYIFQSQLRPDDARFGGQIVSGIGRRFSEGTAYGDSYALSPYRWSLPWHLISTLPRQIGWPVYLSSLIGLIAMLFGREHRRSGIYILITILAFILPIGYLRRAPWRDVIPIVPLFTVSAAYALVFTVNVINQRWSRKWGQPRKALLLAALTAIVVLWPVINISRYNHLIQQVDTRDIAREWIEANIPAGTRIALQPFSPGIIDEALFADSSGSATRNQSKEPGWAAGRPTYSLTTLVPSVGGVIPADEVLSQISDSEAAYVITSSAYYGRFYNDALDRHLPGLSEEGRQMHDMLATNLELVNEFIPNWSDRPGPVIKIFAVHDDFDIQKSLIPGIFDPYPGLTPPASAVGYYQFAPR